MMRTENPTPQPPPPVGLAAPAAQSGLGEGEKENTPPSLLGKGAGGLGSARLRLAAVVALVAVAAVAVWYFVLREPEPKNDLERFQGDWQIAVAAGKEGRKTDNVVRVSGDRWEYVAGPTTKAYRVTVNESANPRQLDLELLDTAGLRGAPVKMHGIYAFDNNKTARVLIVAASDPRPATLDDPDGGVLVLTKVKLEQDAQQKR